jgi:hypothetical protein
LPFWLSLGIPIFSVAEFYMQNFTGIIERFNIAWNKPNNQNIQNSQYKHIHHFHSKEPGFL